MNLSELIDTPLTLTVETVKESGFRLSESIDSWDKEIIQRVHEEVPYVSAYPYEIKFKNIDRKFGYAVGSVQFTDLKDTYIPVVIRKYELSPLDILVSGPKSMPMTNDTFNEVIADKARLGSLVDPMQTQSLVERQNAQANDLTDYPVAKYGFLKKACGDTTLLRNTAKDNVQYLMNYRDNGTYEILKQALHVPAKPEVCYEPERVDGKDISIVNVAPYEHIEKAAVCRVASSDNQFHEGVLVKNVFDLGLEKQAFSLFIGDDGVYGFQDKFAGVVRPMDYMNKVASVKNANYGVGDEITLMAKTANSCMATIPIRVTSKSTVDGYTKVGGHTCYGEPVSLLFTPGIKTITKIGSAYHIPSQKMEAVKLGSHKKFHWNIDTIKSQAIAKYASNTTKIVYGNLMATIDNSFIKCSGMVQLSEAYEVLKKYYNNPIDMIKTASKKGSAVFTGVKFGFTKQAEAVSVNTDVCKNFKLAAALTDPDAVDAVLSLGYINEANISEFIEAIPQFEEVISKLSKLLLSIRLGLKGDEYNTRTAMNELQRVTDTLKNLRG